MIRVKNVVVISRCSHDGCRRNWSFDIFHETISIFWNRFQFRHCSILLSMGCFVPRTRFWRPSRLKGSYYIKGLKDYDSCSMSHTNKNRICRIYFKILNRRLFHCLKYKTERLLTGLHLLMHLSKWTSWFY